MVQPVDPMERRGQRRRFLARFKTMEHSPADPLEWWDSRSLGGQAKPRLSSRFLTPVEAGLRGTPRPTRGQPLPGATQQFAEGQWQAIRVQLEREGWAPSQVDLVRDQLRQGWSLTIAKRNVARLSGRCPINSRQGS